MSQTYMKPAVLITGAGARVGNVLARGLAEDGWAVAVHYNRSRNGAEALVKDIKDAGGQAAAVQANLNVPSDLNTLVERASDALACPLTVLINNASTFESDTAGNFTPALFDHHMEANLRAPLILSQHFADQAAAGGCIINITDNRVLKPKSDYFTYAMSKAGLHWATKTMAQAFAPNIRVNSIGPGPTLKNKDQTEAEFEAEKNATLLGDGSPPDSLLQATRYLLSAASVTGQMIAVDGGQHLNEP